MKIGTLFIYLVLAFALAAITSYPAVAEVVLDPENISWTTEGGVVIFQLTFQNLGIEPSPMVPAEMYFQEFGAFVPHFMPDPLDFDIPPIPPDSFFDVVLEVPMDQLPPSAGELLPWAKGPGPVMLDTKQQPCPPDPHWDGNIDIIWFQPGMPPAQTVAHYGTLQVCPEYGCSYIHVVTACPFLTFWNVVGVCPGFSVTIVNEDFTPAANPLASGWSGHICVTADNTVNIGDTCCFAVNFTCGGVMVPVNLCVTACDCVTISAESSTWGTLKALYR